MASNFIFVAIIQALFVQFAYSQCVNRVVPNCQMPIEYLPIEPTYIPIEVQNQVLNQAGLTCPVSNPVPSCAYPTPSLAATEYAPIVYQNLAATEYAPIVYQNLGATEYAPIAYQNLAATEYAPIVYQNLAATEYAPIVYQDSSVANNLANTLQLMVVSNLLRSTLPGVCEPEYVDPYKPVNPVSPYGYSY